MATFHDLEMDKFYLIRYNHGDEIRMIQIAMASNRCVLVFEFQQQMDISYWKLKDEGIAEIVEELSEEKIEEYEELILEDDEEYEFYDDDDKNDSKHNDDRKKKKKKKKK